MIFLTIALFASASLVRNEDAPLTEQEDKKEEDSGSDDQWCCCDNKPVQNKKDKMICLTDEGSTGLLEVEAKEAEVPRDGFSVLVEDTIVRSCRDETPQPCAGECLTKSYVTFQQHKRTGERFDREYTLPVEKWAAAKYETKYYSAEAQGRKHVLETESGNVYAKVGDASKHGLAKKKFCTRWETYAYWKWSESDGGDNLIEKAAAGYKAMKNKMGSAWSCVEKKKCVQYVEVADACGAKNVHRGDGEEKDLEHLTGLGGELYELVGRKGQCQDPEVKEGKYEQKAAGYWKWMKEKAKVAGAGSQCPSGTFHSSKGPQNSPTIPYRFCDCNGECK